MQVDPSRRFDGKSKRVIKKKMLMAYYFPACGKVPEDIRVRKREIHEKRTKRHAGQYKRAIYHERSVRFPMIHFY
jgi:hypothetical protein